MNEPEKHPVILFDGVCNLCYTSVQYVIKHDPQKVFRFASLQSPFAQKILTGQNLSSNDYRSFILFAGNKIYTRSTAALLVARRLSGFAKFLYVFMILPKFMRDAAYNIIAKNRYKWFGKKQDCRLPAPELKNLFLDTTM
ncbi:MAG TPA: thiol-disulfide oxidoreductase DCC family protein [Parafilimonas sp.]|nr:thiol-disulfide oxidoreductase DCC family protein [Parafilimonas sp.]